MAGDLRLMLVLMEIAHHAGLIANQFELINGHLMETDPDTPDRLGVGTKLARMAELAAAELTVASSSLKQRDTELAQRVAADDEVINQLNREVFATTLLTGADQHARELSMRHVLIARSLERIGDNAVDIAEQTVFLVTGRLHEFTDASRPKPS